MKIKGLNGRDYNLSVAGMEPLGDDERPRSDLHLAIRKTLRSIFPCYKIYEEIYLPGCSTSLYLDFLIPQLRIAVEGQGEQHFKFIPHFHGVYQNFVNSRNRDNEKIEFCELNNIKLIQLEKSDESNWRNKILN